MLEKWTSERAFYMIDRYRVRMTFAFGGTPEPLKKVATKRSTPVMVQKEDAPNQTNELTSALVRLGTPIQKVQGYGSFDSMFAITKVNSNG